LDSCEEGNGAVGLTKDVADVGIGQEGGDLGEERFSDDKLHARSEGVVTSPPVFEDNGVADAKKEFFSEPRSSEECGKLEDREIIYRESVERVAEQLFSARAEGVCFPTGAKNLSEFLGLTVWRGAIGDFEGVEAEGCLGLERLENNDPSDVLLPSKGRSLGKVGDDAVGEVAVDIKERKARALVDVLADEVFDEVTFSDAGEPHHSKVRGAVLFPENDRLLTLRLMGNAQDEVFSSVRKGWLTSAQLLKELK